MDVEMRTNSTRDKVLEILQKNTGIFLSGEKIATDLHVTRASVWKAIKSLQAGGEIEIEAVTNRGYRINLRDNQLSEAAIAKSYDYGDCRVSIDTHIYDEVDSTNDEARRLYESISNADGRGKGKEEFSSSDKVSRGLLVIANSQTKGRGRRGRSFFSPRGTGLYMSILVPESIYKNDRLYVLTGMAASSVATAIDRTLFGGKEVAGIKWVNDIYIGDRKVAGILSEAFIDNIDSAENYVIIGIGINIIDPTGGFPRELQNIAGSCIGCGSRLEEDSACGAEQGIRNKLAEEVVRCLFFNLSHQDASLETYRRKSILPGHYVKINTFDDKKTRKEYALVRGITDGYELEVEYENGDVERLSSGEVSTAKY